MLTYKYTRGSQPLTISARAISGAENFARELDRGTVATQNRWDNAMLFLRCGVDWPAWQELHRRTYESRQVDPLGFYDPWRMTDEFEGLCRTAPIDFDGVYQSLSILPAALAVRYVTFAHYSRQLIERKSLEPDDLLTLEQLLGPAPTGLVVASSFAPIDLLLARAKSSDLAHCFAELGLPRAKNMQMAKHFIHEHRDSPEIVAALQSSPRWANILYLLPPHGYTWEEFQSFRFIIKGMAQDFWSYMDGFPIFKKRQYDI
jgi:hypothetical protein